MNNLGSVQPPGSKSASPSQAVNPFARALAESEKTAFSKQQKAPQSSTNLFSEALAKTGGKLPENMPPQDLIKQQEKLAADHKKAELRKKLHDQVNPVNKEDIFNANRLRTQKELEEVRKELKNLAVEITKFYKEVDIQTTRQVTDQGQEGTGLKTYFQKLKAFIILLTQKVRSARTWMQQQQAKQRKQKRKVKGGLAFEGSGHQESKTIFDMMHHERSSAYSGS